MKAGIGQLGKLDCLSPTKKSFQRKNKTFFFLGGGAILSVPLLSLTISMLMNRSTALLQKKSKPIFPSGVEKEVSDPRETPNPRRLAPTWVVLTDTPVSRLGLNSATTGPARTPALPRLADKEASAFPKGV